MMEEMIDIVDENDNVIDTVTRSEMRQKDLLHRDVKIFVFNSKGELFIHQRTYTKDHFPGYYGISVGGAVSSGEDYDNTAKRELEEEVGIVGVDLKFHFKFIYQNETNVISKVYSCVYDGTITIQEEEIEKGFFVSIDKLKELMQKEKFCPDDIAVFDKLIKELEE